MQGPVLVIAPHPDDETLGCGATIARLCEAGHKVRVVIVTDGRASTKSSIVSPDALAAQRREEAIQAAEALGLSHEDVVFLNYRDGKTTEHIAEITRGILQQVTLFVPAIVFSPCNMDVHSDHRAIAAAIEGLQHAGRITCPVWQYPIWTGLPNWLYNVLRMLLTLNNSQSCKRIEITNYLEKKQTALARYRSQLENFSSEKDWKYIKPDAIERFQFPYELFLERRSLNCRA